MIGIEFNLEKTITKEPIKNIENKKEKPVIEKFESVLKGIKETNVEEKTTKKSENEDFLGNIELEKLPEDELLQLILAISNLLLPAKETSENNLEFNEEITLENDFVIAEAPKEEVIELLEKLLPEIGKKLEESPVVIDNVEKIQLVDNIIIPKEQAKTFKELVEKVIDNKLVEIPIDHKDVTNIKEILSSITGEIKSSIEKVQLEKPSSVEELLSKDSPIKELIVTLKNLSTKSEIEPLKKVVTLENPKIEPIILKESQEETVIKDSIITKEDKFLSKILEEDNTTTNKFTLFNNRMQSKGIETKVETPAPTPINKATVAQDVIKNIKYIERNNIQQLTVKVYPKELGEVTIKLLSEDGIMKAELKATSKETYNILNSNLAEIKKALSEQSIKIQDVNIGLYNEDATFFAGQNSKEHNFNNENQWQYGKESKGSNDFLEEIENENIIEEGNFLDREV